MERGFAAPKKGIYLSACIAQAGTDKPARKTAGKHGLMLFIIILKICDHLCPKSLLLNGPYET